MSELGPNGPDGREETRAERLTEETDAAFENTLRRALRPVNAPDTLAKFLAVAAEAQAARAARGRNVIAFTPRSGGRVLVLGRAPTQALMALAAAGVIAAVLGGSVHLRHAHRRLEATREFDESVRITEQTMEHTREQLRRAGIALEGDGSLGPQ